MVTFYSIPVDQNTTIIQVTKQSEQLEQNCFSMTPDKTDDNEASGIPVNNSNSRTVTKTVAQIHRLTSDVKEKDSHRNLVSRIDGSKNIDVNYVQIQEQFNLTEDEKIMQTEGRTVKGQLNDKRSNTQNSNLVEVQSNDKNQTDLGNRFDYNTMIPPNHLNKEGLEKTPIIRNTTCNKSESSTDLPDTETSSLQMGFLTVPDLHDRRIALSLKDDDEKIDSYRITKPVHPTSQLSYQSFPGHSNFILMKASDWLKHGGHYDRDGFDIQSNFGHFDTKSREAPWLSQFRMPEQHVFVTSHGSVMEDVSIEDHDGRSMIRSYHTNKELHHDKFEVGT